MVLTFDISQDEMPIFMAEVDEQLQALDVDLVRLEKSTGDLDLLQRLFRAAHTLKGMAGFIGHHRMVNMTHALETAFDGLRKNKLTVTTSLVNLCLKAVDGLKLLRQEVVSGVECRVEVSPLIAQFEEILGTTVAVPVLPAPVKSNGKDILKVEAQVTSAGQASTSSQKFNVRVEIAPNSFASAARAFQIMLSLQGLGEIISITPSQELIETAAPVSSVLAVVETGSSEAEVLRALQEVPEISLVKVSPIEPVAAAVSYPTQAPPSASPSSTPGQADPELPRPAADAPVVGKTPVQASKEEERSKAATSQANMTVRTTVERLDALMNLVGELITDRNQLNQIRVRMKSDAQGNMENLSDTVGHLARITDQLQEEVMRIRMLPMSNVFNKFPRMVRDLAQKTGKIVDLVIHGEETELDRSMIEEINDPLIHLVRNSVDHGIETPEERRAAGKPEKGTVTLDARHEQGRIVLTIEDDGRGIDPDVIRKSSVNKGMVTEEEAAAMTDTQAIDFIFKPGFSTAKVLSDISGRGVGLDIVQTNIHRVNGIIQIETKVGQGSQFIITLPLTLAIVPTLLVKVEEAVFAVPLVMVTETLRLKGGDIKTIRGKPVTVVRDTLLPLVYLNEALDLPVLKTERKYYFVVVVHSGKERMGLVVDSLCGEEEVVVKSLGSIIGNIPGVSSAAILGDGKVALIIDVSGLFKSMGLH
jgi:two-component system, chemotaxis family, sensor kinase CheA